MKVFYKENEEKYVIAHYHFTKNGNILMTF